MGMFSDFVVAKKTEGKKVGRAALTGDNPSEQWPGFSFKNVDSLSIASLWAVIKGVNSTKAVVALHQKLECVYSHRDGVLVNLFPEEFTELLAAIEPTGARTLAKKWRADKEGGVSHWAASDVQALVKELCAIAKRAVADRQSIIMSLSGF